MKVNRRGILLSVGITLTLILNFGLLAYNGAMIERSLVNQIAIAGAINELSQSNEQVASELAALVKYLSEISGELLTETDAQGEFSLKVHLTAVHRRNGIIMGFSEHAGTLTDIGADYIEGLLGNNASTASAQWISLSNNASAPDSGWTQIPEEIAANNMSRAQGAYTSTGTGQWTIVKTFTASGSQSVQLAGLNWAPSGDNNLLCADQISAASLIDDDTLELTWTLTVS
jgi:hypothetical protein